MDDMALLREYAGSHSETAFEELVRRRVGFVYATALRQVREPHLAEEVVQAVFVILAQKAGRISAKTILAGWLFKTTRFAALAQIRTAARRQRREKEAQMQIRLHAATPDPLWEQMSPLLDQALAALGEKDRQAVLLRFIENKSLAEVGNSLGLREDTARKRVNRALEKLRRYFSRRGVASTSAILGETISTNSVQIPPVGLVKSVTAVALTKGTAASMSTLTLIQGALKIMAWTKAKAAIVAAVVVLLVAGPIAFTAAKMITPPPPFIRIAGKGQIELYNYFGKSRVVETGNLVILTDGKSYRISIASQGHSNLTNDVYDLNANYGSDGIDTFVLSDQLSYFHRTHEGFGGFAYPGRFPGSASKIVDAVWLAYCSKDYFSISNNRTGLKLFDEFSMVWPDFITNQVVYWPNSTRPQRITGWSRNWVLGVRTNSNQPKQAMELKQYPHGFKAWEFTASDPVIIGTMQVPRQITLETFFPKPPNTAARGDDTEPLRKATFVVDSIEQVEGRVNPLPPLAIPDLPVEDWRFIDTAGNFVIESHATLKGGWPTRGTTGFKQAAAEADKLASDNPDLIQSELDNERTITPP